ncbi:MAG: type II toxin-antitoxin system HicA family toxin [Bryobacterales bacterium]|nr:type II toxin-antitoxin system HicA family toxin [Bryobacterales bacterium]
MARLPSLTTRRVVRALKRAGFVEDRQRGSHLILVHPETGARTVVPIHSGRTIKEPLLRAFIRDAGLTSDEFLGLVWVRLRRRLLAIGRTDRTAPSLALWAFDWNAICPSPGAEFEFPWERRSAYGQNTVLSRVSMKSPWRRILSSFSGRSFPVETASPSRRPSTEWKSGCATRVQPE